MIVGLSLDGIDVSGTRIEYTLIFSGDYNKTIKLNTDNISYRVDDNLMIEIIPTDDKDGVSIKMYYN